MMIEGSRSDTCLAVQKEQGRTGKVEEPRQEKQAPMTEESIDSPGHLHLPQWGR